jgi:hypothetical protein
VPRIFVEPWDPDFGSAFAHEELATSVAVVDPSVEVPKESWKPIPPEPGSSDAQRIAFIDGVRRADALVWIEDRDGRFRPGLCASYAAGVVTIEHRAEIQEIQVRRGLLTNAPSAAALETEAGIYVPVPVAGESLAQLSTALQERLRRLEIEVAIQAFQAFHESPLDFVVVDGPLSSHHARPGVVGYVKSHHVSYLEPELERIVGRLSELERTPLFLTTTSYPRYSTYLRLPYERTHPLSGVVRLEFSAEAPFSDVRRLASLAARTLPRFGSVSHKEPRAPQNLFPVGALERELRRRLGDPAIVHRALRTAADFSRLDRSR